MMTGIYVLVEFTESAVVLTRFRSKTLSFIKSRGRERHWLLVTVYLPFHISSGL